MDTETALPSNPGMNVMSFETALNESTKDLGAKLDRQKNKGGRPKDSPEVKEQKRLERNRKRRKNQDFVPRNEKQPQEYGAPLESNVFSESAGDLNPAEPLPQMDFKPVLTQGFQLPFKLWAAKTHCPAVAVTAEELAAPMEYANQMLNYYAPRMESLDPGKTAMVMFGISMMMLVSEKSMILAEFQTAPAVVTNSQDQKAPPLPSKPQETSVIPSGSYARG